MRVLIVEDHLKLARLIKRGLRREEVEVDLAGDGPEALAVIATTEYDAIVLDLMLPGIDGLDICRGLRADGLRTPILMLSARGAPRDRAACLEAGADDYLSKPFSYVELLTRLQALMRRDIGGEASGRAHRASET
jgi:two-component system, OmpR family, response regulator